MRKWKDNGTNSYWLDSQPAQQSATITYISRRLQDGSVNASTLCRPTYILVRWGLRRPWILKSGLWAQCSCRLTNYSGKIEIPGRSYLDDTCQRDFQLAHASVQAIEPAAVPNTSPRHTTRTQERWILILANTTTLQGAKSDEANSKFRQSVRSRVTSLSQMFIHFQIFVISLHAMETNHVENSQIPLLVIEHGNGQCSFTGRATEPMMIKLLIEMRQNVRKKVGCNWLSHKPSIWRKFGTRLHSNGTGGGWRNGSVQATRGLQLATSMIGTIRICNNTLCQTWNTAPHHPFKYRYSTMLTTGIGSFNQ